MKLNGSFPPQIIGGPDYPRYRSRATPKVLLDVVPLKARMLKTNKRKYGSSHPKHFLKINVSQKKAKSMKK